MSRYEKMAFIDETGDAQLDLELDCIAGYYILAAIVIDKSRYEEVCLHFETVRDKYFKSKEMKSTLRRLKNKPCEREEILKALAEIDFKLYLYVVNKSQLSKTSGLNYPKNFIKYFHKQFYNCILDDHCLIDIVSDEIKGQKFRDEFSRYMKKKLGADGERLFYPVKFEFVDSKKNVCIQAADFIVGVVAQSFENKTSMEFHEKHKQILEPHIVVFDVFPEIFSPYVITNPQQHWDKFDYQIEQRALYNSSEFIKTYTQSDDDSHQSQVLCLRALRECYFQKGKSNWLPTPSLLELSGINSEQVLRGLIGRLRDAGNLIVSRHSGGYKLATCKADYCEFLNVMNTQISPMIARIKTARNNVLRATDKKIDILEEMQYTNLKAIIDLDNDWIAPESD